jgi:type III secretory pathway component EscU
MRDTETIDELLTVAEVAVILHMSHDTVLRKFRDMQGVLNLGSERRRVLRIPRSVLDKYLAERQVRPHR